MKLMLKPVTKIFALCIADPVGCLETQRNTGYANTTQHNRFDTVEMFTDVPAYETFRALIAAGKA
jgi:hypothetical protein